MTSRLFWFAVGAAVTVYVVVKAQDLLSKAAPDALASRARDSVLDASDSARGFVARVRAASAEREAELRDALGLPQ